MRRNYVLAGLLAVAAGVLAYSRAPDAAGANDPPWMNEMAPLFGGFRLLQPRKVVVAEAERQGRDMVCLVGPLGDGLMCPYGNRPAPPGQSALSFGFHRGVLVGLERSTRVEARRLPPDTLVAAFRRAFGDPRVEGEVEPGVYTWMWAAPDRTALGTLTCFSLDGDEYCEAELMHYRDPRDLENDLASERDMLRDPAYGESTEDVPE